MGMNLNLRQIIRNQKTKNFDLISLISEKDDFDDFEEWLDELSSRYQ